MSTIEIAVLLVGVILILLIPKMPRLSLYPMISHRYVEALVKGGVLFAVVVFASGFSLELITERVEAGAVAVIAYALGTYFLSDT